MVKGDLLVVKNRIVRLLKSRPGFALPTVLIASVVMLGVLVTGLQSATGVQAAITQQYRDQLLKEAGEAGQAMASYCHSMNFAWAQPLKPGTDCLGNQLASCAAGAACNYVSQQTNINTSFSVSAPVGSYPNYTFKTTATIEQKRSTGSTIVESRSKGFNRLTTYRTYIPVKGGNHSTCAIVTGKLYCWGWNAYGQSGNPDNTGSYQSSPYRIEFPAPAKYVYDVVAAYYHTCAVAGTTITPTVNDSRLYCWGYSQWGQFGDGTNHPDTFDSTKIQRTPKRVWGPLSSYAITKVSGRDNTCVQYESAPGTLTGTKYIRCWGLNDFGQSGDNASGAGSDQDNTANLLDPKFNIPNYSVKYISDGSYIDDAVDLNAVTYRNGCAVRGYNTSSRFVSCWGTNVLGQTGDGVGTGWNTRAKTKAVNATDGTALDETRVLQTNNSHACVLNGVAATNRRIFCWGSGGDPVDYRASVHWGNIQNQTPLAMDAGAGASAAINVRTSTDYITDFAVADGSTCFLKSTGNIYCWGYNGSGELGQGTAVLATDQTGANGPEFNGNVTPSITGSGTSQRPLSPRNAVQVRGKLTNGVYELDNQVFRKIGAGYGHFCASTDRGRTYCWGANEYGQLGLGFRTTTGCKCVPTPQRIALPLPSVNY